MTTTTPKQSLTVDLKAHMYRRALAAYFRDSANNDQPSESRSGVETVDGLHYVVLRNTHQLLAVYRIRAMNDGLKLKRLKRIPAELKD